MPRRRPRGTSRAAAAAPRPVDGVDRARRVAADATIRSPRSMPGALGGAAVLDAAHQQPVALRQPDRAAHAAAPRAAARSRRRAARRARHLAAPQRLDPLAHGVARRGSRRSGRRPAARVLRPSRRPSDVDERPARRAARQRRGVLDRAADRAARAGRGSRRRRTRRSPSVVRRPRPPGFASASTTASRAPSESPGRPTRRARVAGVDAHDRQVDVGVDAGHLASRGGRRRTRPSPRSPRRLCAFVSTGPRAITTPDPRPSRARAPRPPGPTRSAAAAIASALPPVPPCAPLLSYLQLASDVPIQMRRGVASRRGGTARQPRSPRRSSASATAGRC